jgi:hypothetical protein
MESLFEYLYERVGREVAFYLYFDADSLVGIRCISVAGIRLHREVQLYLGDTEQRMMLYHDTLHGRYILACAGFYMQCIDGHLCG